MTKTSLDISALVGSRICHDLISPLGAIANGVELMALSGVPQTPEMELIAQSVENANARIKMFRIAYGGARADQQISSAEVTSIMDGLTKGGRLIYLWDMQGDSLRQHVRFAMLLVQAVESALAYGGTISIHESAGRWTVTGKAERLSYDADLWRHIDTPTDGTSDVLASHVQFKLIGTLRQEHGYDLSHSVTDSEIVLTF